MKKILAIGLAALLAGTTLTATAASAKDWHHHHHHGHYYGGGGWGWGGGGWAPFAFGTMLGYGLGSYYNQPYYGYYDGGGYYGNSHIQWCASHYRTYNPRTNTFFVRPGVARVCVSPYG